mmetsp:Transcript_5819/g.16191  ORF Transcript_5819/g.16191 Transcript_5819/m.16191 type:complete len:239 (+) Transcript_5819:227-943(+)
MPGRKRLSLFGRTWNLTALWQRSRMLCRSTMLQMISTGCAKMWCMYSSISSLVRSDRDSLPKESTSCMVSCRLSSSRSRSCFWIWIPNPLDTLLCCRKRLTSCILEFRPCFSMMLWVSLADSREMSELKTITPHTRQKMFTRRSKELTASTFMEPGVICARLQWKAVKYRYVSPMSWYARPLDCLPLTIGWLIQCVPVSASAQRPTAYQMQAMTWFTHRSTARSFRTSQITSKPGGMS